MGRGPGRSDREEMTLVEFFDRFPNDETAETWFIEQRWPDGVRCTRCDSANVAERKNRKPRQWRCRDCRKDFSVRTDTLMHNTKLGHRTWALAMYLMTTSLKDVSSMKLHRDLGVCYSTAWHLSHRIREAYADGCNVLRFAGPVEVDETFIGGKAKNMHAHEAQAPDRARRCGQDRSGRRQGPSHRQGHRSARRAHRRCHFGGGLSGCFPSRKVSPSL